MPEDIGDYTVTKICQNFDSRSSHEVTIIDNDLPYGKKFDIRR